MASISDVSQCDRQEFDADDLEELAAGSWTSAPLLLVLLASVLNFFLHGSTVQAYFGFSAFNGVELMVLVVAAQVAVLAIWLALGPGSIAPRVVAVGCCFIALTAGWLLPVIFSTSAWYESLVMMMKILVASQAFGLICIALIFVYLRYTRGWRIVGREYDGAVPAGKPLRFGLKHMFLTTAIVAVAIGFGNFGQESWVVVAAGIISLAVTPLLAPALPLVIGVSRKVSGLDKLILSTFVIVALFDVFVRLGVLGPYAKILDWLIVGYALFLFGLLWLSWFGWRLARPGDDLGRFCGVRATVDTNTPRQSVGRTNPSLHRWVGSTLRLLADSRPDVRAVGGWRGAMVLLVLACAALNYAVWRWSSMWMTLGNRDVLVFSTVCAPMALLALWLALGPGNWPRRLLGSLLGYVVVAGVPAVMDAKARFARGFPLVGRDVLRYSLIGSMELVYFLSVVALLCYFRYSRGWRLVGARFFDEVPTGKPLRFGLKHIFLLTTLVAVVIGLHGYHDGPLPHIGAAIVGQVTGAIFAASLPLILARYGSSRLAPVDAAILTLFAIFVASSGLTELRNESAALLAWYLLSVLLLGWLWVCGWRLARPRDGC